MTSERSVTEEAYHQIMEGFNDTWPQNQEKYEESEKLKYGYQRKSYSTEGSP